MRRGTYFAQAFQIRTRTAPVDITGWTFEADIRATLEGEALITLTTANGGFAITDAANGLFEMRVLAELNADIPVGVVVFDVLRTDADPGPRWLFGGKIRVREPVTRADGGS